ncbi:hypothetical protein T492DRAFT_1036553 [Pavlovales sp. CCMP2436]|nr:hypothetical protein T492DRAFT_1036553 [Pavlovales sp. CCMP2436]
MAAVCAERHGVVVEVADVAAWAAAEVAAGHAGGFGAVVFNSCFGNMHSPRAALAAACSAASPRGGRVVISHPLGRAFVERLRAEDPSVVPHALPADAAELGALAEGLPLRLMQLSDEPPAEAPAPASPGFYCVVFEQHVPSTLAQVLLMRGEVSRGYGRGSAQLGVPTANLREDEFAGALAAVPAGVYCGWAAVEGAAERGGPAIHRAVVNVGYSPTFAGAENACKIVEAHLMAEEGRGFAADFYGRPMRLLLCAFLRPEHKFGSFPLLVGAINKDISESARILAEEPCAAFARDPFLQMALASDGTVGLMGGKQFKQGALFKAVDFELARSMAAMQSE